MKSTTRSESRVAELRTFAQVEKAIGRSAEASRPLVIKFYAPDNAASMHCLAPKTVAPWFEKFCESNSPKVDFAAVNIDLDDAVASSYGVTIIPAFHVWNRGARVAVFSHEPERINEAVNEALVSWKRIIDDSDSKSKTIANTRRVPILVLPFEVARIKQNGVGVNEPTALESIATAYVDKPTALESIATAYADEPVYPIPVSTMGNLMLMNGAVAKKQRLAYDAIDDDGYRSSYASESVCDRIYSFCGC